MKRIIKVSDDDFNVFADALHIPRSASQINIPGGSLLIVMRKDDCKSPGLMTREEARLKIIQFNYNPQFLDMLAAFGLIKFKEEIRDPLIEEAKHMSDQFVEYDHNNPAISISKMSKMIDRLLKRIAVMQHDCNNT